MAIFARLAGKGPGPCLSVRSWCVPRRGPGSSSARGSSSAWTRHSRAASRSCRRCGLRAVYPWHPVRRHLLESQRARMDGHPGETGL